MAISGNRLLIGFIAGALAVAIFHQGMYWAMKQAGMTLAGSPWSLAPARAAFGLPTLVNQMFWGGLWGVLFAAFYEKWPGGAGWLKGMLFGMVFPMLLGSWLVIALIRGQPMFSGFFVDLDLMRLRNGLLLNGIAFGIGLGLVYPLLRRAFNGGA